jgi:hypothetical protein
LMLSDKPPPNFCPSISVKSIDLFFQFKVKKGHALTTHDGEPLLDVATKLQIISQGSWNSPTNLKQCLSAINDLHKARDQSGQYSESCDDCIALDQVENGCRFHRGSPHLWRTGNPGLHLFISNHVRMNNIAGKSHITKGDTPLTPWELRDIRQSLLCQNKLVGLMNWVIILLAVKLFLRSEEVCGIRIEDFKLELTTFSGDGRVTGLCVDIQVYNNNPGKV